MKSLVLIASLLACGLAYPQAPAPDKNTDNRVGLERPSTAEPPKTSECGLDALLGEVFGNSGSKGDERVPDNSGGSQNGGLPNQPDAGNGGYPNQPDASNGGYPNQPDAGNGGYPNQPDAGNGGYPNQPENPDNGYQPQPGQNTGGDQGDCTCVQYYLCNDNNTINDDGVGLIDIRIKDEECSDYLQKCCGGMNIREPTNPITPKPTPNQQTTKCGNRNFEGIGFRITGANDNEAQYGEFPWMVAIIRPDQTLSAQGKTVNVYQCGGSLIHPQVVLTGAHCVKGKSNLLIRAGEWDTQTKNELYPTQDRKVREVITHEQFNNGSLANDPALLILENPVDMTVENVGLICLPQANENMDGRDCVASGWGKDLFGKEGKYQVILKRVDVPTVPRGPCLESLRKTRLGQRFKLHDSFICAGGIPGKDTCKGDGGSPLVCPSRGNSRVYVQAGIVAWGIDCGTATPGVYVNVPYFVNWINTKLQARNIYLDGE